ncbi:hypothetical protein GCM10010145_17050 [Streptomyces ruber]|uniref:Uncharacterized protein n=1 Tax=Streptomyces ruber TaxID=83378 RepID=A0A918BCM8_9ACTN|nr:hypothetical protein GCM10010145_17050 [Streptomyces ruber]
MRMMPVLQGGDGAALTVHSRFSAWPRTREADEETTSPVTSGPVGSLRSRAAARRAWCGRRTRTAGSAPLCTARATGLDSCFLAGTAEGGAYGTGSGGAAPGQ